MGRAVNFYGPILGNFLANSGSFYNKAQGIAVELIGRKSNHLQKPPNTSRRGPSVIVHKRIKHQAHPIYPAAGILLNKDGCAFPLQKSVHEHANYNHQRNDNTRKKPHV
jgi:hypothetical protein